MCAAVVLRSQDCLRKPPFPPRRKPAANCNPNNAFRKRSPTRAAVNPDRISDAPKNNLVMGQVKILKRGEALPPVSKEFTKPDSPPAPATETEKPAPKVIEKPVQTVVTEKPVSSTKVGFVDRGDDKDKDDMILCSMGRMGPEPETVRKQIKAFDFYAGLSPTMASPPPSSVPVPSFFSKMKAKTKVDTATNDLLRLLKIDLS